MTERERDVERERKRARWGRRGRERGQETDRERDIGRERRKAILFLLTPH